MNNRSKLPVLLLELVVMLLIFSICAAICLNIFAYAREISMDSRNLDKAVLKVQSAAEEYKASGGAPSQISGINGEICHESVYYDENWNRSDENEACFHILIEDMGDHAYVKALDMRRNEEIFGVNVKAVAYGG